MTLADLSPSRWQRIARSEPDAQGAPVWVWDLDVYDRDALDLARMGGAVITAQRRVGEGVYELLARRARMRG